METCTKCVELTKKIETLNNKILCIKYECNNLKKDKLKTNNNNIVNQENNKEFKKEIAILNFNNLMNKIIK
jgi:adenylyl- and sulfurtransferase ThiI